MSQNPILSIRDLTVAYDDRGKITTAVSNVSLDLTRGDFVALVGESGSGKSTLSATLIGLLPPSARIVSGSIRLGGEELVGLDEKAFAALRGRRIGMVPQDPATSLNPVLTIGAQVGEVFSIHAGQRMSRAEIRDRSEEILKLAGIDRPDFRLRQYPHELSGGLKQRVLIAMAFGLRPDLLIADEPTSALDVTVQAHVLDTFDRLVAEFSTAVLFVTHDLAVATDHANRALVMHNGVIVEQGPVVDIVGRPQHAYTRNLLAAASPHFAGGPAIAAEPAGQASRQGEIAVRADNLVKRYRLRGQTTALTAVDGVSFDIARGTTFSLVGESASGKTTVARMVLGLVEPTSGHIEVNGRALDPSQSSQRREIWRNVQYVYQNPGRALEPRHSVETIIAEPLNAFAVGDKASRRKRVLDLLDHVALPAALLGRRSRDLSGGQQQRVALARALALGADVLVLDEPLSALDVVTQAQITELLGQLQRDLGLTYLFISHDLAVVRSISDTVGVMQRGKLVEIGPVDAVFGAAQAPYTRQLLEAIPGKRFGTAIAALRRSA